MNVLRPLARTRSTATVGTLLRAELEARQMTQADLAIRSGLSAKHINQVMSASASLSSKVALSLEQTLGVSAELLLAMDARTQVQRTRAIQRDSLLADLAWAQTFPLDELRRRNLLGNESGAALVEKLLAFFGVSNRQSYERTYLANMVGFKRSQRYTVNEASTALWLRLAELQVEGRSLDDFDISRVRKTIPLLPPLTRLSDPDGFRDARRLLARTGIALSFVRDIPGCRASGATRWLPTGHALIVVSDRFQRSDGLWFSLFHELGHVTLHPKRKIIVSLGGDGDDSEGYESEANQFAASVIVPGAHRNVLSTCRDAADIKKLATTLSVHAGLIAGQWAHGSDRVAWMVAAKLRRKLDTSSLEDAASDAD